MESTVISDWRSIKLLTVPEVAAWARVHPKTVNRWIHTGQMQAICFGPRTYRIPEAEVVRVLSKMGLKHLIPNIPA